MAKVVYRTYAEQIPLTFNTVRASGINKPVGGLWGCRNSEWWDWCQSEEFPCADKYFEWELKEGVNIYTVDNENDFVMLLYRYPHVMNVTTGVVPDIVDTIDFEKMWADGYDGIELTEEGNDRLHFGLRAGLHDFKPKNALTVQLVNDNSYSTPMLLGMNGWDVPSINVFDPDKSVRIISNLKKQKNPRILSSPVEGVEVTLGDWGGLHVHN